MYLLSLLLYINQFKYKSFTQTFVIQFQFSHSHVETRQELMVMKS